MCCDKNNVSAMDSMYPLISEIDYDIINRNNNFNYSGDVVTMECVEKLIKKDWINPLDNSKLSPSDIILLQRVKIMHRQLRCR